jgi:signal transduction histidine kinase
MTLPSVWCRVIRRRGCARQLQNLPMLTIARESTDESGIQSDFAALLYADPWPIAASIATAVLTCAVLAIGLAPVLAAGWGVLAAFAHLAHLGLWRAYRLAPSGASEATRWLRLFAFSRLAFGIVWGSLALAIAADVDSAVQVFIYTATVGVLAGSAIAFRAHVPAVYAIVWSASVPIIVASAARAEPIHVAIAALFVAYAVGASRLGRHLHRSLAYALVSRQERERLTAELAAGGIQLDAANAELAIANERLETLNSDLVRAHADTEAASRAKSEFLANMGHELRTPLNAIIGFAEVIELETFGPIGPRYREYATDIHGSGRHLLQVINDILDLAKVESGKMQLHEVRIDAAVLMQGCVRLIKPRAAKGNIRLLMDFDPHLPVLLADEARLRQIGLNLLSNAVKFTKAGGRVSVSTTVNPEGGIVIAVTDTGIGMTPEEIIVALEPFRQVMTSQSRTNEGTGLGLPLTKTLVELHGGRLDIASVPGRGTTVSVTFPSARSLANRTDVAS